MLTRHPQWSRAFAAGLPVLAILALSSCFCADDDMHPAMTTSVATMAGSSLEDLEAQMARVAIERVWSGQYLQGGHVHQAWVEGNDLLLEVIAPETGSHELHAIDISRRGQPKWMVDLGPFALRFPPQADDRYVVGILDEGGGMVVIDRRTGSRDRRMRIPLEVVPAGAAVSSDSTVYLGSLADNRLYAMSPATGQRGWHYRAQGTVVSGPHMTPRLPRRQVIVATDLGEVISLPAAAWTDVPPEGPAWSRRLLGAVGGTLAIAESMGEGGVMVSVLAPCEDNGLYCLEGATGDSRWVFRTDAPFRSEPQAMGGKVFARNARRMHVIDLATGARAWPASEAGAGPKDYELARHALAADGERVYLMAGDGRVVRFHAASGAQVGTATLDRFDMVLPTGDANLLLGLTRGGAIVAFR